MRTSETIDTTNKLKAAEDYNFLRREGIKHIEKLAGDVWTDFNTHDPGITILESLCYAITDLAYRTGFDIKDLLAQAGEGKQSWKNIFYTAREILTCNPVTINDYRKLVMDVKGVRNAWITTSKDCEVPVYLNKPTLDDFQIRIGELRGNLTEKDLLCCGSSLKLPYKVKVDSAPGGEITYGLNYTDGKIIELNGLYKIIIEYEEEIIDQHKEPDVRKNVLKTLHKHRNVCEDFLSVTGAEYRDFFLVANVSISESADADMILAEMCYLIQNYFTPCIKFYSLDELVEKGKPVDEIFEGPALKHGFILDEDLEKTDMFRDMRLSDIINFISDIKGVNALNKFSVNDNLMNVGDTCSDESFFSSWIESMQLEKLVGRLSLDDMLKFFHPSEEDLYKAVSDIHFLKPSGEVTINTDRFQKLLNDLKGKDKYMKMQGFANNFPVPIGENMELDNFYPVQYELPFIYRVGKPGLPLFDGKQRLVQSLQLKGYLAVFEQLFLNYMQDLGNLNEIFSFNDIKFKGQTKHGQEVSSCECLEHTKEKEDDTENNKYRQPATNEMIYKNEAGEICEKIAGYKCLYHDAEKYLNELQGIIQSEADFEWQRNNMLDHLLSRFNEEMDEYVSLMKYLYPSDYLSRVIKNKTDLLSDYPAISNNRARAYNYKLEEEGTDYVNQTWDEEKIALNISGLEKRIARLIGLHDYKRKDLAPGNMKIENIITDNTAAANDKPPAKKIVLYEKGLSGKYLLETKPIEEVECLDAFMHAFIDSGCCSDNFLKYPEEQKPQHRHHHHRHHHECSFALVDKDGKEVAFSPIYHNAEHRDEAMQRAKCSLEKICHSEGFHMIEHILLRPRGDEQLTDNAGKNYGGEFKLLDICLNKCDISIHADKTIADTTTDTVNYKFDLQVLPPEKCRDGKRWNVTLSRIRQDGALLTKPVKILEHPFKTYELASDFISKVRNYGSELKNFLVYKTKIGERFYFKLVDDNGATLVESSCFKLFTEDALIGKKPIPGIRTECVTDIEGNIINEIKELKKFLAAELDLYCCEEPCDHNEDPYSFRVTFVLPCWPGRFRNKGFRKFVEKTIYEETPSHIHPKIFWLGITEMREYEEPYFDWLIEMSCNDVPDIGISNEFIMQLLGLKNCDEFCADDESNDEMGIETAFSNKAVKYKPVKMKKREIEKQGSKKGKETEKDKGKKKNK